MDGDLQPLIERLSSIGEDLAEHAVSLLREALAADDESVRPDLAAAERRVTRARRAVEKAIRELDPSTQASGS